MTTRKLISKEKGVTLLHPSWEKFWEGSLYAAAIVPILSHHCPHPISISVIRRQQENNLCPTRNVKRGLKHLEERGFITIDRKSGKIELVPEIRKELLAAYQELEPIN